MVLLEGNCKVHEFDASGLDLGLRLEHHDLEVAVMRVSEGMVTGVASFHL
jgi:hypothetical protein